jgi:hypothetical protein
MTEHFEEYVSEEPDGVLVHWMDPKPLAIGSIELSSVVVGAFALGAVAALAGVALFKALTRHRLSEEELLSGWH